MNIIYTQNPLNTIIELNEFEKKELWYKIKIKEMQELLEDAHFSLTDKQYFSIEEAQDAVDINYYYPENKNEKSNLDKRCDELFNYAIKELSQRGHAGDCTCIPTSCGRCWAEEFFGLDSTKGLSKYSGHTIFHFFNKHKDATIDDLITIFSKEQKDIDTYNWLLNYKKEKLKI